MNSSPSQMANNKKHRSNMCSYYICFCSGVNMLLPQTPINILHVTVYRHNVACFSAHVAVFAMFLSAELCSVLTPSRNVHAIRKSSIMEPSEHRFSTFQLEGEQH